MTTAPSQLRLAVAQLDYIPRLVTRGGLWIPDEPLMADDPLAVVEATKSVQTMTIKGRDEFRRELTISNRKMELRSQQEFNSKLRSILDFIARRNVHVLVLPEGCCNTSALRVIQEYRQEFAVFAGLGVVRGEDLDSLPELPGEGQDLVQRNTAIYIDRERISYVTKRFLAASEQADEGAGISYVSIRVGDQTYRMALAICLDFLNYSTQLAADTDCALISALTPSLEDFQLRPQNYIRVFANHARYGGTTILAPSIYGYGLTDQNKVQPLLSGSEGVTIVDFAGYPTKPTRTLPRRSVLISRAQILRKSEKESDAYNYATDLARMSTDDFKPEGNEYDFARKAVVQIQEDKGFGAFAEALLGLDAAVSSGTLTSAALTMFASHVLLEDVATVVDIRYMQLMAICSLLRRAISSADRPIEGAGGYFDDYMEAVDSLLPQVKLQYRTRDHQNAVPYLDESDSEETADEVATVFFAARLGSYHGNEAAASLSRQLAALHTIVKVADKRLRIIYRLTTGRDERNEMAPWFDVIGYVDGANREEIASLREGLGQQLGMAFAGSWDVSGSPMKPRMSQQWHRALSARNGQRPLAIRDDWAPLVDYLRSLRDPMTVELECRWSNQTPIDDYPAAVEPTILTAVTGGYANDPEQIAARLLQRMALTQSRENGSLRLIARIGASIEPATSAIYAIGDTLLGHADFEPSDDLDSEIGNYTPEMVLRLFHPPYGKMLGRGLNSTRPTKILVSGRSFPREGVVVGTASTAGARNDQDVEVRLSDTTRLRHTYVIGRTGSGKTNLLKEMARQDIEAKSGVAVIDPHGDLVDYLLGHLAGRESETLLLDFGDPEYLPVLNPLDLDVKREGTPEYSLSADQTLAIEEFISILVHQSYHEFYGPRFEDIVRLTLEAILQPDYPFPPSVLEVAKLLRSRDRRRWLRSRLRDTGLKQRWDVFESQSDTEIGEVLHWALSKFSEMSEDGVLGQVLAGGESSISINKVVNNSGILLVRLPEWEMSASAANFLGTLIQERVRRAAFGRWRERRDDSGSISAFHLYVDEFQNFVTTGFGDLVAEARKFGLSLTLANQNLAQLNRFSRFTGAPATGVSEALLSNVATFIVLGVSSRDASIVSDEMGVSIAEIRDIGAWTGLIRTLAIDGGPARPFTVNLRDADKAQPSRTMPDRIRHRMIAENFWRARSELTSRFVDQEEQMTQLLQRYNLSKSSGQAASSEPGEDSDWLARWGEKQKPNSPTDD